MQQGDDELSDLLRRLQLSGGSGVNACSTWLDAEISDQPYVAESAVFLKQRRFDGESKPM